MKQIIIAIIFALIAIPVFAYDYSDDNIQLTISDNGNWIITLDSSTYYMDWIDGKLRTAGLDGICYWYNGIDIEQCTLQEYSTFIGEL